MILMIKGKARQLDTIDDLARVVRQEFGPGGTIEMESDMLSGIVTKAGKQVGKFTVRR